MVDAIRYQTRHWFDWNKPKDWVRWVLKQLWDESDTWVPATATTTALGWWATYAASLNPAIPVSAAGFMPFMAGLVPSGILGSKLVQGLTKWYMGREATYAERLFGCITGQMSWGGITLLKLQSLGGLTCFEWIVLNPLAILAVAGIYPAVNEGKNASWWILNKYEDKFGEDSINPTYAGAFVLSTELLFVAAWLYFCYTQFFEGSLTSGMQEAARKRAAKAFGYEGKLDSVNRRGGSYSRTIYKLVKHHRSIIC